MTKTWQLRALCVYLTLGLPLAASCAKEANTLEGDDTGVGATSSGGSTSKAGATSKAGTTSTSAFGGTSSKAGSGAGGKTGTAGSVAADGGDSGTTAGTTSGGKAGGGGTGGGGTAGSGASMVPPDVLARAKVIVYYQTQEATPMDKKIQMKLNITNQSPDPLPMDHVKIRYWFTAEVATELHQYFVGADIGPHAAVFVNDAENSHALMTFSGGSIKVGGDINASEIQLEITNNSSPFNQADDYSWQPAYSSRTPSDKVTLYLDDKLIWGCEPSGVCFDDGAGGAGGAAGQGAGGAP